MEDLCKQLIPMKVSIKSVSMFLAICALSFSTGCSKDNEAQIQEDYYRPSVAVDVNGVRFTMIGIAGGTFTMGATSEQQNPQDDEKPVHQVTLSDYCIGETEVTQELWVAVMGNHYHLIKGDNLPITLVSWEDCQTFIAKLNEITGKKFRLPTEAEWEYAARGGKSQEVQYQYSGSNNPVAVGWCRGLSPSDNIKPVKQLQKNGLFLYDMSGNVFEWCNDWYGSYSGSAQTNPTGPARSEGHFRVCRGGSFKSDVGYCRVSARFKAEKDGCYSDIGLRLAL